LGRWSDIDPAFGVREGTDLRSALDDFTEYMPQEQHALDTLDVVRDPWIYRVFLLPSTLQVDLAFAPASHAAMRVVGRQSSPLLRLRALAFNDGAAVRDLKMGLTRPMKWRS